MKCCVSSKRSSVSGSSSFRAKASSMRTLMRRGMRSSWSALEESTTLRGGVFAAWLTAFDGNFDKRISANSMRDAAGMVLYSSMPFQRCTMLWAGSSSMATRYASKASAPFPSFKTDLRVAALGEIEAPRRPFAWFVSSANCGLMRKSGSSSTFIRWYAFSLARSKSLSSTLRCLKPSWMVCRVAASSWIGSGQPSSRNRS
mmetsp:Transcript_6278/g.17582  ORF Transcript_6278/g.17582 Transcript_6278/m.17582 type:complete len:201 (-) Transcript_6278:633-1235(-)